MDGETKVKLANEFFNNKTMSKEQYKEFQHLVEDLDMDYIEPSPSWDEITENL